MAQGCLPPPSDIELFLLVLREFVSVISDVRPNVWIWILTSGSHFKHENSIVASPLTLPTLLFRDFGEEVQSEHVEQFWRSRDRTQSYKAYVAGRLSVNSQRCAFHKYNGFVG